MGITSATGVAPELYSESSNVYYELLEGEETPFRLIITPDEREKEHAFKYQKKIMPATMKVNIDTPCQYRKGMMYVLYEEELDGSGTVVMVLDQMNGASSGSYQKISENITVEVEFEEYYDSVDKSNRLRWDCNIMSDAYANPIEKIYKIGAINRMTNEHICDYGFISSVGHEVGGYEIETKEMRKLSHAVSYADWKSGVDPFVGMTINTEEGNPKEYPNVCEVATIFLDKYLVEEAYALNTQFTATL